MRTARPPATTRATTRSEPALELDFDDWLEATPRTQSEVRIVTRPNLEAPTDEAWAREMVGAPYVAVPGAQLVRVPLGHRAGFLLSRMDGKSDMETVIALSAMPRDEALRLVRDLYDSGIIGFRPNPRLNQR
jgi:hypothetical protein